MLIIFGFKTYTKLLATLSIVCPNCHNPAAHRLFKITRKFTLFFIPLFPVSVRRRIDCTFCGYAQKLSKEQADQVMSSAQQTEQPAAPGSQAPQQQPPAAG
ncbi:MAG: zinc-ribbon domain-containing protein [Nocardioides sp.]|nr:zinc-ribbon domain-containing protein [Nocardioides sp.]